VGRASLPPDPTAGPDVRTPGGEAGFVAVEWVAAIVFLLLPVVLIGAGAEETRPAVLSETQVGALANANVVAAEVAANYGVPADQFEVTVSTPNWDWGQPVTVTVTMAMPTLDVPGVGSWSTTRWSASSTQRIEDYRGLE
jgi:hypothetical protein